MNASPREDQQRDEQEREPPPAAVRMAAVAALQSPRQAGVLHQLVQCPGRGLFSPAGSTTGQPRCELRKEV